MQKDRRRDESLVERFHRVLAEFEIVIEEDEDSLEAVSHDFEPNANATNARSAAYDYVINHSINTFDAINHSIKNSM